MKWYKKAIIAVASLLLLIVLLNVGLNFWISKRLPHIINEANDSPYHITYKNLDISLLSRDLKATEIILVPKSSLNNSANKAGIYANIESLDVANFNIWDLAFSNKIHAKSLTLTKPEITIIKDQKKVKRDEKAIRNEIVEPFGKLVYVSDVFLIHANLRMVDTDNKPILTVHNLSFNLEKILITEETLAQKLPFSFEKYTVVCDSLFYQPNPFYHIRGKNFKTTEQDLEIGSFEMVPEHSRKGFVKLIPKEKDQFAIKANSIAVNQLKWGFKKDDFFFNTDAIILDELDANIYRNKMPEDDLTKKKLYNNLLRNIPFELKVDTLLIKNSRLVYEEEIDFSKGPGILTFNQFNMFVTGISSAKNHTKLPDTKIKVTCQFMNVAPMDVDWTFNVLDKNDGFNIKGTIFNFPAERISAFTKPYINASLKGDLDEVYFNFTGNDNNAKGDFAINYDDLKVDIYKKKDRKKKNKFLTSLANLFVKDDTKDKVNTAEVELERIKEKSFYNFLWRSIAEGLKKILI